MKKEVVVRVWVEVPEVSTFEGARAQVGDSRIIQLVNKDLLAVTRKNVARQIESIVQ